MKNTTLFNEGVAVVSNQVPVIAPFVQLYQALENQAKHNASSQLHLHHALRLEENDLRLMKLEAGMQITSDILSRIQELFRGNIDSDPIKELMAFQKGPNNQSIFLPRIFYDSDIVTKFLANRNDYGSDVKITSFSPEMNVQFEHNKLHFLARDKDKCIHLCQTPPGIFNMLLHWQDAKLKDARKNGTLNIGQFNRYNQLGFMYDINGVPMQPHLIQRVVDRTAHAIGKVFWDIGGTLQNTLTSKSQYPSRDELKGKSRRQIGAREYFLNQAAFVSIATMVIAFVGASYSYISKNNKNPLDNSAEYPFVGKLYVTIYDHILTKERLKEITQFLNVTFSENTFIDTESARELSHSKVSSLSFDNPNISLESLNELKNYSGEIAFQKLRIDKRAVAILRDFKASRLVLKLAEDIALIDLRLFQLYSGELYLYFDETMSLIDINDISQHKENFHLVVDKLIPGIAERLSFYSGKLSIAHAPEINESMAKLILGFRSREIHFMIGEMQPGAKSILEKKYNIIISEIGYPSIKLVRKAS